MGGRTLERTEVVEISTLCVIRRKEKCHLKPGKECFIKYKTEIYPGSER